MDDQTLGLIGNFTPHGSLIGTLSSPGSLSGRLSNATLRGERIELRVNENNYLQYRYEGQDDSQWQDLIELNNLNYNELINKPSINDITLIGNLTPADLGLSTRSEGIATISRNGLTYTVTRPDGSTFPFDQLDQENVIESVSVNGTQLTVSNKNVDVTVPTAVSQLQNDSNYATQSYVDSGIDSIAAAMPTKVSDLTNDSNFTTQTYVDTELAKKQNALPMDTPTSADIGKALMPKTVENGVVTSWEFGEAGMVDDVTINGTSIVNNKIAEIPMATSQDFGVVKVDTYASGYQGGIATLDGKLYVIGTNLGNIKNGIDLSKSIAAGNQHQAVFYGLAKAAGSDEKNSTLSFGTYTDEAKSAIQTMLGVPAVDDVVTDVQVNGTSILSDGVANIPVADTSTFGVVKTRPAYGIRIQDGYLTLSQASEAMIKAGATSMNAIVPQYQHESVFYGLAKIAGSDEKDSTLPLGTYTDEAKSAIQTMLGVPSASDVVTDVQISGTSVVNNGVANIFNIEGLYGIIKTSNGYLAIRGANSSYIKNGQSYGEPILPTKQHESVFYGLAKAAGSDEKNSTLPLGTYTDAAKTAIQSMLGIDTAIANAVGQITGFDFSVVQELPDSGVKGIIYLVAHSHGDNDGYDEYIWINDSFEKLGHVDIDLSNYVTFDDYATANEAGVVKINGLGLTMIADGRLCIVKATDSELKGGTNNYDAVVPSKQHMSTFYGLAKAAGDSTQSASANTVGTYTDDAKTAIQTMLGVPANDEVVKDVQINGASIVSNGAANIPIATANNLGVVKIDSGYGVAMYSNNKLTTSPASISNIKPGTEVWKPIVPYWQHASTFYGLAKAAGDTTMASSSNAVGTYTTEAKAAIQTMLGIPDEIAAELINYEESSSTITNAQIDALFI